MMELILKTIIGPIVVGVILRLVDKWLSVKKTLGNLNKSNGNLNLTNEATIPRVTHHTISHFFTTQSIIAGVPLKPLSQMLGHTKVYMTDRYNQVEGELAEATTDLFLSHIRYKSPCQFPDQNPKNIGKLFLG